MVREVGAEHFPNPVRLVAAVLAGGVLDDRHRLVRSDFPNPREGRCDRLVGIDPLVGLGRVAPPVVGVDPGPVDVGVARVPGRRVGERVVPEAVDDPGPGDVGRALRTTRSWKWRQAATNSDRDPTHTIRRSSPTRGRRRTGGPMPSLPGPNFGSPRPGRHWRSVRAWYHRGPSSPTGSRSSPGSGSSPLPRNPPRAGSC